MLRFENKKKINHTQLLFLFLFFFSRDLSKNIAAVYLILISLH